MKHPNDRPNDRPNDDLELDRRARTLHAQSLAHLSAATRLRLRVAAHRPAPRTGWRLAVPLAAACAIGVLALGLQRLRAPEPAPPPDIEAAAAIGFVEPAYAPLDESPDLYLWLASADAAAFALE
jgi:hypothetical protein